MNVLSQGDVPIHVVLNRLARSNLVSASKADADPTVHCIARTARSRIVRIRLSPASGFRHLVAKTYLTRTDGEEATANRVTADFSLQQRAFTAMSGEAGLGVARPLACFPDIRTTVMEEVPGRTLHQLMNSPAWRRSKQQSEVRTAILERVGLWSRRFQELMGDADMIPSRSFRVRMEEDLARLLRPTGMLNRADHTRIEAAYAHLFGQLPLGEVTQVPVHGDFHPSNIIVDGTNVTVVDFAGTRPGVRCEDAAHLCVHLESLIYKPWVGRDVVTRACRAVIRGMDLAIGPEDVFYQLMVLRDRVARLCRLQACPLPYPYKVFLQRNVLANIRRQCAACHPG